MINGLTRPDKVELSYRTDERRFRDADFECSKPDYTIRIKPAMLGSDASIKLFASEPLELCL